MAKRSAPYAKHVKRFDALLDLETPANGWDTDHAPPSYGQLLTDELAAALKEEVERHQEDGRPDQAYFNAYWGGYERFGHIAMGVHRLKEKMSEVSLQMALANNHPEAEAQLPRMFQELGGCMGCLQGMAGHYRLRAEECRGAIHGISAGRDNPDASINVFHRGIQQLLEGMGINPDTIDTETAIVQLHREQRMVEARAGAVEKLHSLMERTVKDAEDLAYARLSGRGGEGRTGGAGS